MMRYRKQYTSAICAANTLLGFVGRIGRRVVRDFAQSQITVGTAGTKQVQVKAFAMLLFDISQNPAAKSAGYRLLSAFSDRQAEGLLLLIHLASLLSKHKIVHAPIVFFGIPYS